MSQKRKQDHIQICLKEQVQSLYLFSGFSHAQFIPRATSSIKQISHETVFLSRRHPYPFMIAGMTGGLDEGQKINQRLAALAHRHKLVMGVGSQRIALENPAFEDLFPKKKDYPGAFLVGNIGAAQIAQALDPVKLCQKAIQMIQADGLAIHLNLVQELVQAEGDRHFFGFLEKLETVIHGLSVPVMIKEVGSGMSSLDAKRLFSLGVRTIDVGGLGGTSWPYIEGLRDEKRKRLGDTFRDWGLPTALCLQNIRQDPSLNSLALCATGGLRTGLDGAKALAMGAQMAGFGLPFLKKALESEEALEEEFQFLVEELKITMIATESRTLNDLAESLIIS